MRQATHRAGLYGRFIAQHAQQEEIDTAIASIRLNVLKLRELSSLWEMYKDGIDLNSIQWAAH